MSKEELETLKRQLEAALGDAYDEIVEHLREKNSLDDIGSQLENGVPNLAVQGVVESAEYMAAAIVAGHDDVATATAGWLNKKLTTKLVKYDGKNEHAVQYAEDTRARLVREVSNDVRGVISEVTARGAMAGTNPRQQAREIRDAIGLTAKQESYVDSYRKALESGDFANALQRELRDGRSDKRLRKLIRDGGSLTPAQVDAMAERYRKNWIRHRSEVIAQTEALKAAHAGNYDMLLQAVESGALAKEDLEREWHTSGRPNVRDSHAEMNHQKRGFDDSFVSGNGNLLMYPGDVSAPASDTIKCHCTVSTIIVGVDDSTTTAPAGFDAQGKHVVEGIPAAGDPLNERLLYRVPIGDIEDDLIALPGGGQDKVRLDSISQAWDDGKKLPPLKLYRLPDGKLFVADGRHRLLTALRDRRDVLVQLEDAAEGTEAGTVPLTLDA